MSNVEDTETIQLSTPSGSGGLTLDRLRRWVDRTADWPAETDVTVSVSRVEHDRYPGTYETTVRLKVSREVP